MATEFVYTLPSGQEASRAEYIRYLFKEKDMSRGEIAQELNVPYSTVYSATANMENSHHQVGQSGGPSRKFVELEDGTRMTRSEYIRKRVQEGVSRSEVAKELNVSYSVVWAATKGMDIVSNGSSGAIVIEHPDTGEQVRRVDYIREAFFEKGMTRREIANQIGCDYAVVWAATRPAKADEPAQDEAPTSEPADESDNLVEDDENFPE